MRNRIYRSTLILGMMISPLAWGQPSQLLQKSKSASVAPKKKITAPAKKPNQGAKTSRQRPTSRNNVPMSSQSQRQLSEALAQVRAGQCESAMPKLYSLSRRNDLNDEKFQIKYIMGNCLLEMNLYQIAAFQFVDVIRNGNTKYTRQSIEKLSIAADELGDDTLLQYAINKVQLESFPEKYKDVIYYRLGEIKLKNNQSQEAVQAFQKVPSSSRYYIQAKFNLGRAHMEANQPNEALKAFQAILQARLNAPVTDVNRVAAQLAIARTYYQAQNWDEAISWYRKIPRDTEFWHEALFEQTWSYLRAAKFRSALSNFQSHHSTYYEDFFIPESLLLRSIVYLYICKYNEMEKVLDLFEKSYGPVRNSISSFLRDQRDPNRYYQEIEAAFLARRNQKPITGIKIPVNVAKAITSQGDIKRSFAYLKNLGDEKKKIEGHPTLSRGAFANYSLKIINNRQRSTRIAIGEMARVHMAKMRVELIDHYEQAGFIRYEMINGQKEQLKKRIAGKEVPGAVAIDEEVQRDFYVQNGYEYYPFDGEYWLDEIGNYHYLGKQSCDQ
jgi:tetratricopeptide (TPR) repeat protein